MSRVQMAAALQRRAQGSARPVAPPAHSTHNLSLWVAAGGALIGGYNPLGWTSQGGDSASDDAFLFFVDDDGASPVKLPKASQKWRQPLLVAVPFGLTAAQKWWTGHCMTAACPSWHACLHAGIHHLAEHLTAGDVSWP